MLAYLTNIFQEERERKYINSRLGQDMSRLHGMACFGVGGCVVCALIERL